MRNNHRRKTSGKLIENASKNLEAKKLGVVVDVGSPVYGFVVVVVVGWV